MAAPTAPKKNGATPAGAGPSPQQRATAAVNQLPDAQKAAVAAEALEGLPDAAKIGVASATFDGLADSDRIGMVARTVQTMPDSAKVNIATTAVAAMPDDASAETARRMLESLPPEHKRSVLHSLFPDQKATNDIWRWTVLTFAVVLVVVTIGVIAAVIVSFWQKVDTMLVQVLLTLFTTAAGTLAGFVSGRASAPRPTG